MATQDAEQFTIQGGFRTAGEVVFDWLPLGILVVLWSLASGSVVAESLLPAPVDVFGYVVALIVSGEVFPHLAISLFRIAIGLGLSIAIGVSLGIGMARSDRVENFFDVFLTLTYPVPKSALVPLAILWVGSGTPTAVFVIFLGALLPIVLNTYNAATQVDENLLWSAKMMGTSERDVLRKVVFPAAIPNIMTGIRQAIPISFIVLISAELIASDVGIGSLILKYGNFGNYPPMFAVIIIFSAVAYIAVRGFETFRARVLSWT